MVEFDQLFMYWSRFKPHFLHTQNHSSDNGRRLKFVESSPGGKSVDSVLERAYIYSTSFKDASGKDHLKLAGLNVQLPDHRASRFAELVVRTTQ